MNINFRRLLHTPLGKIIVSILLGLGCASLFYTACKGRDCIVFDGPVLSEMDGKIYQHADECFQYHVVSTPCDPLKKSVNTSTILSVDSPDRFL